MKPVCYIVGASPEAGPEINFTPNEDDFVIAADGGFSHLTKQHIRCDLVVGDFDSSVCPDFPAVIQLNPQKDDTDTLFAVRQGLQRGYTRFIIYGVLGGALSHTISALQTLTFLLDHGAKGLLIGKNICAAAIRNDRIDFRAASQGFFSVFSFDEVSRGVFIEGAKYPLHDYTMTNGFPIGVSNEFIGNPVGISVNNGTLHILFEANGEPDKVLYQF
ncbi:MAG: thiamine diphosphokinase [Clostridiales bacterium]|nr:thiamine diphosphokinase [Clostridiales bacterium]